MLSLGLARTIIVVTQSYVTRANAVTFSPNGSNRLVPSLLVDPDGKHGTRIVPSTPWNRIYGLKKSAGIVLSRLFLSELDRWILLFQRFLTQIGLITATTTSNARSANENGGFR